MAKKPTIVSVTSGYNSTTTINQNFEAVRTAFDNTLSRDGSTPNAMNADLDMNSNDILNINDLDIAGTLTVNGTDINDLLAGLGSGEVYAVTNRYTGDGVTAAFTLTVAPVAKANTFAYINGIYQQKSAYSLSGTTLTFDSAPPVGSNNIEIITLTAVEGVAVDASTVTSDANGNVQADLDELFSFYGTFAEGAWTPVVSDAVTGGNLATASVVNGRYSKVGSIVYVSFEIQDIVTTGMTGGNSVYIQGLPFTVTNAGFETLGSPMLGCNAVTFTNTPFLSTTPNSKSMRIRQNISGGSGTYLTVSSLTSGTADLFGRLTYKTDE